MSSADEDLLDPTWAEYGSLTSAQRLERDGRRHQRDVALTSHERELRAGAAAAGLDELVDGVAWWVRMLADQAQGRPVTPAPSPPLSARQIAGWQRVIAALTKYPDRFRPAVCARYVRESRLVRNNGTESGGKQLSAG